MTATQPADASRWTVLRRRVFWILIGLGLLHFLFNFAFIYLKATINVQNGSFGNRQILRRFGHVPGEY